MQVVRYGLYARRPVLTRVGCTSLLWKQDGVISTRVISSRGPKESAEEALSLAKLPSEVIDLNHIGENYHRLGMYKEAAEAFQSALDLVEQKHPQHLQVATIKNNLAMVHLQERNFDIAERLLKQAVELRVSHFNTPWHEKVAVLFDNLGVCYQHQQRHNEAIAAFERSVNIRSNTNNNELDEDEDGEEQLERQKGAERMGVTQNNIGLSYYKIGDLPNALKWFQDAAQSSPKNPTIWKNFAACAKNLENWETAEKAFRKLLDLLLEEGDLMWHDKQVLDTMTSLATVCQATNKIEEATRLLNQVKQGQKKNQQQKN